MNKLIIGVVVVALLGGVLWWWMQPEGVPDGFVVGNGRIEATEINASAKLAGRVEEVLVDEGEFVEAGQPLVRMQTNVLRAQRDEAAATHQRAIHAVASAKAQVAVRRSDLAAAQAVLVQRESELEEAERNLERMESAFRRGGATQQELDQQRTQTRVARAAVGVAQAQVVAAEAAIGAAEAEVVGAESAAAAAAATVARIDADIADSVLRAPRAARVQYILAQPGEVLASGGRALNLIDLSDVFMTFFVPERAAGRIALGSEARIVLDAAPQYVIPARISFVASEAQFTPKTVETAEERQKLMFRVRAQIPPELLKRHIEHVKVGVPGVAWVRLDERVPWPEKLAVTVGQ